MDAFPALFLWCFLVVTREINCQSPTTTTSEIIADISNLTTTTIVNEITTPVPEAMSCSTARKLSGNCVLRQYCDYGTPAIDYTLYVPKTYKKSCDSGKVCCPPNFVIASDASSSAQRNNNENFDDD